MHEQKDTLKLEKQLSFSLYACSKELIRAYKPLLEQLNLTYTQYLAMTVLWEFGQTNSKVMGRLLYLDSGTLTPVLKALEQKGYLRRSRGQLDGRHLIITITDEGYKLKDKAAHLPQKAAQKMGLSEEESATLQQLLTKLLNNLNDAH
ncbi:MAG: MarR family transcriptional regulator [Peptococcaceae bacterium]|nr:MarR family transcriptional regulator [Peptococcaceae bacterium]